MAQPPFFPSFPPNVDGFTGGGGYDSPPTILPPNRSSYDFNSQIMLTAIVSFSFVIVVVVSLHLYARCLLSRQARGRTAMRGLIFGHTAPGEPPKSGLDPAVIASLPTFVFKVEEGRDDATSIECAVCLSVLEDQEMARILPNCKHTFHAECIDKWLSSHSTCPICRAEAEPRVQPEPREGPVGGAPVAPTLENVNSTLVRIEETSEISGPVQSSPSPKVSSSGTRLSSFRRMLSWERSSRGIHSEIQEDHGVEDLERQ